MCGICGGKGYIELINYEICKNCSYTQEQIKNRMWNNCKVCNVHGYHGRGTLMKIIKQRCPNCFFNNKCKNI